MVKTYLQNKFLTIPKQGASVCKIQDIGQVVDNDTPEDATTIQGAEFIGVAALDSYSACLACKSKVEATDNSIGTCTKCGMQQRLTKCKQQLRAKLYISSGENYFTLQAFGTNVVDIAQEQDVTTTSLLTARPFTLTNENIIITSITRP